MAAAAIPLIVAGISAAATLHASEAASSAARNNKPPTPPTPPKLADETALDDQSRMRRKRLTGAGSAYLTGPQGLGANGQPGGGLSTTLGSA